MPIDAPARPDVLEEIGVDALAHLDWEPSVPCDVTDCQQPAAWWIICGVCSVGRETVCQMHYNMFQFAIKEKEDARITFNNSCGHAPLLSMCWWEPFKL